MNESTSGEPIRYDDRDARRVLDRMGDAFFVVDRDWRLVFMNPAARAMVERRAGRPAEEMLGQSHWSAFPGLKGTAFEHRYREAMETQAPAHFTARIPDRDVYLEVSAYPSPDRLSIFARDVTEREQAKRDAAAARRRLERVLEANPAVVYQCEAGEVGEAGDEGACRLTWLSPTVETLLGFTPVEALAPGWWEERVHPSDVERVREVRRRAGPGGEGSVRYRFRDRSDAYRWIHDQFRRGEGHDPTVGSWLDATPLVESERERHTTRIRLEALVESASDVIGIMAGDGTMLYVNPAVRSSLGYEPQDLVGRNVFALVHPDDLPVVGEAFTRAIRGQQRDQPVEYRIMAADGAPHTHQALAKRLPYGAESQRVEVLVISRDITLQRRAEASLREDESYFRILLDSVDVAAVAMLTPTGQIVSWNAGARRLYGYEERDVLGRDFSMLFREEDVQAGLPRRLLEQAAETGGLRREVWRKPKQGDPVPASLRLTPLHNDAGAVIGYSTVSVRRSVEAALGDDAGSDDAGGDAAAGPPPPPPPAP